MHHAIIAAGLVALATSPSFAQATGKPPGVEAPATTLTVPGPEPLPLGLLMHPDGLPPHVLPGTAVTATV